MQYLDAFNALVDDLEGNSGKPSQWGDVFGIQPDNWKRYAKKEGISRTVPTRSDAYAYYRTEWWLPYRCEDLPDKLDFAFFQWLVNHGPSAIKDLQLCLGVAPDGILGPETLSAGRRCDPVKSSICLLNRQRVFYEQDARANAHAPLAGWDDRIRKTCLLLGIPVKDVGLSK
ncbi:glycosyl hydrolase 108 family protein [Leptospirillum ferriphilum]|uniref:glycosyl hydrolase 108 family protein n=1 Tax=Leptospirillum ferriphilum TaxID=178606 RepID=UPI000984DB45|nr:glycosyl hydrolase 108 family protein [Leptospirillum ferriphilum]OOH80804.1 hypothetical protein BOX30_05555 [Leptospirillum ferriphilum]